MLPTAAVTPPFFEIGPKAYLVGDEVLDLARAADAASERHGVDVIFTTPFSQISRVADATEHLKVCAPHMDALRRGRGLADILPEELRAVGAHGVMLNHAERPISYSVLEATVRRAEEVGLFTIVCASSLAEVEAVALLGPDIVVAEPTELIGSGSTSDLSYMCASTEAVRDIDPRILVLQAAGIADPEDVYRVIATGAQATGSSSGIACAANRAYLVDAMLSAVRQAWNQRPQPNHRAAKRES